MYCKNCGKQIAEDSKFCQYCGGIQDIYIESEACKGDSHDLCKKGVDTSEKRKHLSESTKWMILGYCFWLVINLYFLFAGDKSSSANDYFQPFSEEMDSSYSYYDITEFIVYVLGLPLLIIGINMLNKHLNSDTSTGQQKKYSNEEEVNDFFELK